MQYTTTKIKVQSVPSSCTSMAYAIYTTTPNLVQIHKVYCYLLLLRPIDLCFYCSEVDGMVMVMVKVF